MTMGGPPRVQPKLRARWLLVAALAMVAAWRGAEWASQRAIHPRFAEMLTAARTMQEASFVLRREKESLGLMQPGDVDPNRTGMIGPEFTGLTTTLGDLASKRTATNPDLAALIVKQLDSLHLPQGAPVALVVSGSFVGGDVAAIVAVEALGLRPILITSLGASMWGANDPAFNLLDMLVLLRARGLIRTGVAAAVIGGEGAVGVGMEPQIVAALRASALRAGAPIMDMRPLSATIEALLARISSALGDSARPAAVINVGGALSGLGTCQDAHELPPGLVRLGACRNGTPGVAFRLAETGAPMLNVINMKRLAIEEGLPFDPRPLPAPGNNPAIYGVIRSGSH